MKFRIFEKPHNLSGDWKFLVFDVKDPLSTSVFQANDIETCYNYIKGLTGRPVDETKDLIWYSERLL